MAKDIFLTNSLGGKKVKFTPKNEKSIGMYVCGPTVYDDPHIGNARPLVVFDILYKILKNRYGSTSVKYIRNITDIDDKIIKASNDQNISINDLTSKITENFQEDCKYLKCETPNSEPKATENIKQMIEMITELEKKGFAYSKDKHVYFEVKKFLGDEFDVHGGGIDLLFPHHENEIAQSRCANDTKIFAKFWMHNAFITMSKEKMAKSQGNILKIKDFRDKISGQVLRLALLSAHYKQPLDWNDKLLDDCQNTINKWYNSYLDIENNSEVSDEILQPLYDDLNTPGYIANLHQLYDKAQKGNDEDKSLFVSACQFVGLLNESKENWLKFKISKALISEKEILQKIQERNKSRENQNYEEADKIRN